MAFQLNALDLTDMTVLEDQLVGVDNAYFEMLMDALRSFNKKKLKKGKIQQADMGTLDGEYLMELIDNIF